MQRPGSPPHPRPRRRLPAVATCSARRSPRGLSAGRVQSVARAADRGPRARDRGVQDRGILEDHRPARAAGTVQVGHADPARRKIFAKRRSRDATKAERRRTTADDEKTRRGEAGRQPEAVPPRARSSPNWPSGTAHEVRASANEADADDDRRGARHGAPTSSRRSSRRTARDGRRRRSRPARCSSRRTSGCTSPRSRTMQTAQKLYEGVDLGSEGPVGAHHLHAYRQHARLERRADGGARPHRHAATATAYLPEKPNFYASGKSAQEAHEAIRPTDVAIHAAAGRAARPARRPAAAVHADLQALRRQPDDAGDLRGHQRRGRRAGDGDGLFKAQGQILKFDGYRKVLAAGGKQEDADAAAADRGAGARPARPDREPALHRSRRRATTRRRWSRRWKRKASAGRAPTPSIIARRSRDRGYVEAEGPPLLRHRDRQGRDRPAGGALPERDGPEVHQPLRGGARRDRDAARCSTTTC